MASRDAIVLMGDGIEAYAQDEKTKHVRITETQIPDSHTTSGVTSPDRPKPIRRTTTRINAGFEDDNLTNIGRAVYKLLENPIVRYCIYVLPVAGLLAIPLCLFATKYRHHQADGIDLLGLFIWIEIVWVCLWISKLVATALPYIFQGICGLVSTGVRKYALVLKAVEIPLSLFIWTILAFASQDVMHVFNKEYYKTRYHATKGDNIHWLHILDRVCRASIGSSALLLAEKMLMQIISVSYHGKQHSDKIKEIKMTSRAVDLLYEASLKCYEDHHPDFADEDYDIHDSTNVQKLLKQYSVDKATMRVFGDIHFYGERLVSAFGRMASDIAGTQVFRPTATHAIVESALERHAGAEALARRIYRSFVQPGAVGIYESDIVEALGTQSQEKAAFIFHQLDRDQNGDVSLEEMISLVTNIARTRKDMWRSACDIQNAIKVLDHVFSLIVFIVVAFIYSMFFSDFLAENYTKIWGVMSGGAFALSSTVGEFNAACIMVFVKHPFDIGDRINIGDVQYEVVRISLLYSIFRRVDNDTHSQFANSALANLSIENVTRSKAMKERLSFAVSAGTTFHDIELLRSELQTFVTAPENSRDYQPEVDIQLLSVGDLKQLDLRVEIRHKSNWANENLRAYRRSKFMCGLLSAMRKVPIDGPAGSAPSQGSINSPNYSVSISEEEAQASRAQFDHEKESKKLRPTGTFPAAMNTATSSGLDILPSLQRYAPRAYEGGGAYTNTTSNTSHANNTTTTTTTSSTFVIDTNMGIGNAVSIPTYAGPQNPFHR